MAPSIPFHRFGRQHSSPHNLSSSSSSSMAALMVGVAGGAAVAAGYLLYTQLVSQYGWEGTARYIWEGQPYTPELQKAMTTLDKSELKLATYESLLSSMEETLDRARLDSVDQFSAMNSATAPDANKKDEASKKQLGILWVAYFADVGNLKKQLSGLSHNFDALAASVDGVVLGGSSSTTDSSTTPSKIHQEMKMKKKSLSKQIVMAMERTDAMVASYQILVQAQ